MRERAAILAGQAERLESLIDEMNRRQDREREAMRDAHELAEERQRSADCEARLLVLVAAPRLPE